MFGNANSYAHRTGQTFLRIRENKLGFVRAGKKGGKRWKKIEGAKDICKEPNSSSKSASSFSYQYMMEAIEADGLEL